MIAGLLKELAVAIGQYVRFHVTGNMEKRPVSSAVAAVGGGIRLDLGCGTQKRVGFLGIDRRAFPGVDGVTDLTQSQWLFDRPKLGSVELVAATQPDGSTAFKLPDNCVAEAF